MMKEILRVSVWCLFIALALNVVFCQMLAPSSVSDLPWLKMITRATPGDKQMRPEYTTIYTTAEPHVRRTSERWWQITFTTTK